MKQINGLIKLITWKIQKNIKDYLKIMIIKKFTEIREENYYKNYLKMKILMNYMQYIVNIKNQ